jgi:hypothetical protein
MREVLWEGTIRMMGKRWKDELDEGSKAGGVGRKTKRVSVSE